MDAVGQFFVELWGALAGFFQRDLGEVLRDCLDIGLVAVLIYWGLVIIRGTRAMQMAAGLVLLFVGYLVSSRLGLITIWTILDSLVTYFVLVVVVIFQADIRRALMRVGRGPLFRGQRTARETAVIEEVVKAATALAQKRIGGLVVFEREAELNEFIESGTVLDASVSKELLYSIFIPSFENPMHDGAVIIRDGRVWQAGAFLPLTGGSHDRTLGTRHRAALGISEETDAVVVVVSEERGATSLCFNGNIVRNLDGDSLRDALFGLFYRPQKAAAAAAPAAKKKKAAQKKKKKKKPAERT
ncbi:MAG TPA: diadenylate cyclase CdaA, partial [Polyangiaceae bacterium LLY-WYZ-15_(1-7)]|nr:diadenylate cyclase CdaA [Polyangiaceae bacterium LLY-WYZ-15_(1-7)]